MRNLHLFIAKLSGYARIVSIVFMIALTSVTQNLLAEANYVYHEQTTNNPGCGPNYMSTTTPNNAASVAIAWKVEFVGFTNQIRLYYTTDGSTPSGAFGTGSGTTQVVVGSYNCSFSGVDVATATIPVQPAGTVVKYIVSGWHSGGGFEIFANGPGTPCACGTPTSNSGLATVFTYTVASSNNVEVTATGGTALASYATLTAAFAAVNAGTHTGTISVRIWGNTTEIATAVLNGSGAGAASYTSISIQPKGGAARTISGSLALPLIDINGADNVTIDGLNTGSNSLTISNTSTSIVSGTSTIRFQTDATSNTITRCSILGSATMALATNGGNIWFGSAAVTTGNDNNTVSFCDIGPAGVNLPSKCVYFSGTSNTDPGTANSGNVITNNNIFDYFSATLASAAIDLNTGSVSTTISNNKFYQSATRTQTTGATHRAISINNSSGNGYQITGNTIGFANSSGTGTYSFVGIASSVFIPIFLSVGTTTTSSVQGNTIAGIAMSGAVSGTSSSAPFRGIYVSAGLTNIGDVTGNTIGSMSATGSITFTSSSTSASDVIAMFNFGSSNWTTNNNNIGGITASNSSTGASNIYGIRCFTSSGVTWTCNSNTIGGTVSNSINSTSTATGTIVCGIFNSAPACTATSNTIRNMTVAGGTGTATAASMMGICMNASSANHTVSQNTIFSLSNTNTTAATVVTGIQYTGTTGANTVSRNNIHSLSVASATATINGININGGTTTYQNNMIRLGIDATGTSISTGCIINGIAEIVAGTDNFYHNSIYIGGTSVSGTNNTFALQSSITTNTRNYRNNILVNARANGAGTGKHYAIRLGGTGVNPTGLSSNYNDLYAPNTGGVLGLYNAVDYASLATWSAANGQDINSISSDPLYLTPTGTSTTVDLHVSNISPVDFSGTLIATVIDDFDGQTRSTLSPTDLGADAFLGPTCAAAVGGTITPSTATACAGLTYNMISTGATAGAGITYQWEISSTGGGVGFANVSGGTGATTANYTTGALAIGTYYYRLNVTCNTGPVTGYSNELTLTVNPTPTASASSNSPVCEGTAINLLGTTDIGTTFAWTGPLAYGSASEDPSIASAILGNAGTYTFTSSVGGCTSTPANTVVVVNPKPTGVIANASPLSLCEGAAITLTSSNNPVGYVMNPAGSETFIDISVTGTSVGILADDSEHNITIPSFSFNGVVYTTARIGNNGAMAFGSAAGEITHINAALPSTANTAGNILLYPYWDDLDIQMGATITQQTIGSKHIIQYTNSAHDAFITGAITFQMQLDVVTGAIHFVYSDVIFGSATYDSGINATVGIQFSSSSAIQYSNLTASLTAGQCISFLPSSVGYSWAGPNAFTAGTQNTSVASAVVASSGIYTVTVTNVATGCSTLASTSAVTVNANVTYYADTDGDSYGDVASTSVSCTGAPGGFVADATDCNDGNSAINPGATEVCNGIDDNCVGGIDEGVLITFYADTDGDTYGDVGSSTLACSPPGGYVANSTDCNDANAAINPAATEVCDGLDNDCDGLTDDADPGITGQPTWYADADGDTYGNLFVTLASCTMPVGYVANATDCNDGNAAINPGATEICNGLDDDCVGGIDNGLIFLDYYTDADSDGYGDSGASPVNSCSAVIGSVTNNTDCNDGNAAINPAATEVCNGIDDDCAGGIDNGLIFLDYYTDADSDGYGDSGASPVNSCSAVIGSVTNNTDCNDGNAAINPGATEICNFIDDDCDGTVDDGITYLIYYADVDGDGYGAGAGSNYCTDPGAGYSLSSTDCNDGNAAINPGATEVCNGIDDDCNGTPDDGLIFLDYYTDADSDGYGDSGASPVNSCSAVIGSVTNNTDCNDGNAAINPGATEICNFIDDDCDGTVDDGITYLIYYADVDGDGYGAGAGSNYCTDPGAGYSLSSTDCNDGNSAINPGATEVCNGIDDDCDGTPDDGLIFLDYYTDADSDGYGDSGASPVNSCSAIVGSVTNNTDCNDGNAAINPGATEICNFIDDDCDGTVDDGITYLVYYADVDGDGYGAGAGSNYCTDPGAGFSLNNTDCDDTEININPGETEICNGIDDDCVGGIDDGLVFTTYYADTDADTYGDAFNTTSTCDGMPAGYVTDATDCDDTQSTVYPGGIEICDGLDNDCDGDFDEGTVTATMTPSGVVQTCKGDPAVLTANAGVGYTYQWFKNGNTIIGATGISYGATKPGYYQVQVNIPEGCFALSAATTVNILTAPNATISAPNGTSLCAVVKLKLNYNATNSYQWYKNDALISGATSYLYVATTPGNYYCIVTNTANGCARTSATMAVTACKQGAIVENATEKMEVYPNPTMREFTIELTTNSLESVATIQLFNIMGELVYNAEAAVKDGVIAENIALENMVPGGLYIVKVLVGNKEYTKQLVIQK